MEKFEVKKKKDFGSWSAMRVSESRSARDDWSRPWILTCSLYARRVFAWGPTSTMNGPHNNRLTAGYLSFFLFFFFALRYFLFCISISPTAAAHNLILLLIESDRAIHPSALMMAVKGNAKQDIHHFRHTPSFAPWPPSNTIEQQRSSNWSQNLSLFLALFRGENNS